MRKLHTVLITVLCLILATPLAAAAKPAKAAKVSQVGKERLVLMALRLGEADKNLQGSMETALVKGLQQKYEVFSGEQVTKKAKEIFNKESRTAKHDCNETRCMQDIAEAFNAELIATASVTKQDGGYFLALKIENIFDNKVVYSESLVCEGCNAFKAVDKLKELSGVPVPATQAIALPAALPVAELPEPAISGNDPESALWSGVRSTNSIEDYETYLAQYPKGKFAALAHSLVAKLQDAAADQAWQAANKVGGESDYQSYLSQYPQGKYAALAKTKLNKLIAEREAREAVQQAKEEADLWHKADTSNDQADVEAYLTRYPAGRYLVAANTKLQRLKEEAVKVQAKIIENIATNMVPIPGKNYEMGKYEVTQAEWKAVMGNNPSTFTNCGDNCPVENVSWNDIQEFLQKLNAKTGKQYRLPTAAEWEYACYGGAGGVFSSPDYCGGDDINAVAWYSGNSNKTTHQAGQKQANGYGLYDMTGNVWEWMGDCYDSGCVGRVLRGGSGVTRNGGSDIDVAGKRNDFIGFRVVSERRAQ